jgi:hypothetical protein
LVCKSRNADEPNLAFAQAVKGVTTGRSWGIIDTIHFMEVAQGIIVFEKSKSLDTQTLATIKKWFADYTLWLIPAKMALPKSLLKITIACAG